MKKNTNIKSREAAKNKQAEKPFISKSVMTWVYLILLTIILFNVYKYIYDKKVFVGGDNAVYYITGLSIASGHGYTNFHSPGNAPANHFPVGYPAIISLIIKVFGDNMEIVKAA